MASLDLSTQDAAHRKKQLIRSNALCGDDDTRLRPLSFPAKHSSTTSSLSRDSTEYTDATGIDLEQFIISTLHKNPKDREMLLNIETEMRRFIADESKQAHKFSKMSSYNRMLVHRVAAFFGLDHNVDQSGLLVVVNKTAATRIPEVEFQKYIRHDSFSDNAFYKKKSVTSLDEGHYGNCNFPALSRLMVPSDGGNAGVIMRPGHAHGWSFDTDPGGSYQCALGTSDVQVRRAHSFEVGNWPAAPAGVPPPRAPFLAPIAPGRIAAVGNSSSWHQLPAVIYPPPAQAFSSANCLVHPAAHSPGQQLGLVHMRPFRGVDHHLTHQYCSLGNESSLSDQTQSLGSGELGSRNCTAGQFTSSHYGSYKARQQASLPMDKSQDSGFEGYPAFVKTTQDHACAQFATAQQQPIDSTGASNEQLAQAGNYYTAYQAPVVQQAYPPPGGVILHRLRDYYQTPSLVDPAAAVVQPGHFNLQGAVQSYNSVPGSITQPADTGFVYPLAIMPPQPQPTTLIQNVYNAASSSLPTSHNPSIAPLSQQLGVLSIGDPHCALSSQPTGSTVCKTPVEKDGQPQAQ